MNEETEKQYIGLANTFYKKYGLIDGKITDSKVIKALDNESRISGNNVWRKLKRAISYEHEIRALTKSAKKIADFKNPNPSAVDKNKILKKVSDEDFLTIMKAASLKNDKEIYYCVYLAKHLGCRSGEIPTIQIKGNQIFIETGKKTFDENGKPIRGLDRVLIIDDGKLLTNLNKCVSFLEKSDINYISRVQDRLRILNKRLFKRRKQIPTLKTFRHQCGSNLKASGYSAKAISAYLGHRVTNSSMTYGNGRSGKAIVDIQASQQTISQVKESENANLTVSEKINNYENSSSSIELNNSDDFDLDI